MAELTSTVAGAIAPAWSLLTAEHSMRFVFESLTDLAFVPSLLRVARRRRHFELFVGVLQFVSVTCYNVADALEVTPFLTARQWHELCNVTTITYALFLCIYLMGNRSENQDHFLRYSAFALVWMAQLRDNYWMVESHYTAYVVVPFAILPLLKIAFGKHVPQYHRGNITRGLSALLVAAGLFYASLDDELDPHRLYHGLAQVAVGFALNYLWQAVPRAWYKKTDTLLPQSNLRLA